MLNEAIIKAPIKNKTLDINYNLYYESIEDIIAKKVKWRKEDNLTRDIFDLAVAISKDKDILHNLVYSRFITFDDLETLNTSLSSLDLNKYGLEIERIEPQTKEYETIAKNARYIIQENIKKISL